jgi:hypothetical protein
MSPSLPTSTMTKRRSKVNWPWTRAVHHRVQLHCLLRNRLVHPPLAGLENVTGLVSHSPKG